MNFDLQGAIDLHVHCSPDVRPRKMTAVELVQAAKAAGMRGLLLKNHDAPTAPLAGVLRELIPGIAVFGGLVLNHAVGGFNPEAVDTALKMGAKQIWMPTHCAEQERRYRGRPGTGLRVLDRSEQLIAPVREILRLIAERDAILGAGHLSPQEIAVLVRDARDAGVKKILVNHPEIKFQQLSESFQREIAGPGLFFERCYARALFTHDWDGLARVTRRIGWQSTVLATDLGQPENPDPITGLAEMRREFAARGFTDGELRVMMCDNPAWLLDLV